MNGENRYLISLAVKNIRRNLGRSFFIGLSVALSVVMAVWILAFFDGLNHQIEGSVVSGNVGYWQLQEKSYSDTTDPLNPRPWTSEIEKDLKHESIIGFSPELVLDGYLSGPDGSAALQVVGVDFQKHAKTFQIEQHIVAGNWPEQDSPGIVIGKETAERFQYNVGDQLVLNFQDSKGDLRSELVPIAAIYHHNGRSFERRYAYVSNNLVEQFLFGSASPGILFHRIAIMAKSLDRPQSHLANLSKKLALDQKSWKNLNPEMGVVIDFHDGLIRFFFVIIGITVTVTILTPVSMLWQERLAEIRMMTIIGVPRKKIFQMGIYEAFVMTILSATSAALVLVVLIGVHSRTGIHFESLTNGQVLERAGIQLPSVIYPLLMPHQLIVTYGFVIVIMLLSYSLAVRNVIKKAQEIA